MTQKPVPDPIPFKATAGGVMGVRAPGEPPYMWNRDMANALNPILKNATICTQLLFEGLKEELEVLDTIVQFLKRMYLTARTTDNIEGLMIYRELLEYLSSETPLGSFTHSQNILLIKTKVYDVFCQMFMLSVFAFMFGSKQMLVASPKSLNESTYDFHALISMLSTLPEDKRKEFVKLARENCMLPNCFDLSLLSRTATRYLDEIQKNQEERYKANV